MTHFTVMVKFEGELNKARAIIEEMLAPYNENLEVEPYKEYLSDKEIERIAKHYGVDLTKSSLTGYDKNKELLKHMKDWRGYEGDVDDKGLFYWRTYNPDSKWDWYSLGGRWSGELKLKKGKNGLKGSAGVFNNEVGIDCAYVKDLDMRSMRSLHTFAVLDKDGWHEPVKMGWFAVTYARKESEKKWYAKFRERFLSDFTDKTIIAIVDCHI